jgi:hypothetical protein
MMIFFITKWSQKTFAYRNDSRRTRAVVRLEGIRSQVIPYDDLH